MIDAEGNAVALTTTVNTWFGAHLLAGKTGIVLNNQMDDFSLAPETPQRLRPGRQRPERGGARQAPAVLDVPHRGAGGRA